MEGAKQTSKYYEIVAVSLKDFIESMTKSMKLSFAERDYAKAGETARLITTYQKFPEETKLIIVDGDKEASFEQYLKERGIEYTKLNSPGLYEENNAFVISDRDYERLISDYEHILLNGKRRGDQEREDPEPTPEPDPDQPTPEPEPPTPGGGDGDEEGDEEPHRGGDGDNERGDEDDHDGDDRGGNEGDGSDEHDGDDRDSDEEQDEEEQDEGSDEDRSEDEDDKNPHSASESKDHEDDSEHGNEEREKGADAHEESAEDHEGHGEPGEKENEDLDEDYPDGKDSESSHSDDEYEDHDAEHPDGRDDDERGDFDDNEPDDRYEEGDEDHEEPQDNDVTQNDDTDYPDEEFPEEPHAESDHNDKDTASEEPGHQDEYQNDWGTSSDSERQEESQGTWDSGNSQEDASHIEESAPYRPYEETYQDTEQPSYSSNESINSSAENNDNFDTQSQDASSRSWEPESVQNEQYFEPQHQEEDYSQNNSTPDFTQPEQTPDYNAGVGLNSFVAPDYAQNGNANQNSDDSNNMDTAAESRFQESYDSSNNQPSSGQQNQAQPTFQNSNEQNQSDHSAYDWNPSGGNAQSGNSEYASGSFNNPQTANQNYQDNNQSVQNERQDEERKVAEVAGAAATTIPLSAVQNGNQDVNHAQPIFGQSSYDSNSSFAPTPQQTEDANNNRNPFVQISVDQNGSNGNTPSNPYDGVGNYNSNEENGNSPANPYDGVGNYNSNDENGRPENQYEGLNHFVNPGAPSDQYEGIGLAHISDDGNYPQLNSPREFSVSAYDMGRVGAANKHDAIGEGIRKTLDPSDELRNTQAARGKEDFSTSMAPIAAFFNPKLAAPTGSAAIGKIGKEFASNEDRQLLGIMVGSQFAADKRLTSQETADAIKTFQDGLTNGFKSFKDQEDFLKSYNRILSTDGFVVRRGAGGLSASGRAKDKEIVNKGSMLNNRREKKKAELTGRGEKWTITAKERQTKNLGSRLTRLNRSGRIPAIDTKQAEALREKMKNTAGVMASYGEIKANADKAKSRGVFKVGLSNAQLQKALKSDATGEQLLKARSNIMMTNMAVKGVANFNANMAAYKLSMCEAKMKETKLTAKTAARMDKKINRLKERQNLYQTVGQWDNILNTEKEKAKRRAKKKLKSTTKNGLKKGVNTLDKVGLKRTAKTARWANAKRRKVVARFKKWFGAESKFMKVMGAPKIFANKVFLAIKKKVIAILLPFLIKLVIVYFVGLFGTCAVAACASVVMGFFEGFGDGLHTMMTTDIDNEEVEKSTLGIVYKELLSNEIDWVENLKTDYYDVEHPPTLDDMKYLTNFTETGEIDWDNHLVDIETYATNVLQTEYRDGKLKGPEPFDLAPDEAYGWLYKFDGGAEVQFASAGGGYRYASNITEIMALAATASEQSDLTYQDYPDENKEDFDDENAAVKLWNSITDLFTKVRTALKNAVTSVFNVAATLLWGEDGKNEFWTRYKTQQNTLVEMAYCKPLFDQSHQEEYSVKMSLLPTKRTEGDVVASWNETTVSASSTLTEQEIENKYKVLDTSTVNTNTISFTEQELNLATKIIEREVSDNKNNASSSDAQKTKYYSGWVACAEVIRNRVLSGSYPNSLSGVLSAKNQFSTYKSASSSTTVNQTVKEIVRRVFNGSEPSVFGRSDVTGWCASGTGNLNHPGEYKVGSILGNDYYSPTEQAAKQYTIETETAESLNLVSVDMCPDEEHDGYGEKAWDKFYYLDVEDTMYHNVDGTLIEASPVEPAGLHDMPEDICVVPDGDPEKWIYRSNNNMDCWSEGAVVGTVDDEVGGEGEYNGSNKITISNRGYSYIGTNDGGKTVQVTVVTDVWPVASGSHTETRYDGMTGDSYDVEVTDYTDHRSTVTYSFTHDCVGDHTGYYCAGHLRLIITGVIYHITEAEKAGTEELMEDKSSKYKISILSNVESTISYLGVGGALAVRVAERVEEKMGLDEQQMRDAKDIFDVDTAIVHKAGVVGPTFEGWTIATQETAAAKVSEAGEWKREYGIDVQGTIGGYDESYFASSYKLSQSEIDSLISSAGEVSGTVSYGDFGSDQGDITSVAQAVAQAFLQANSSHPYSVTKPITVKTSWGSYNIYPCCAGGTTLVAKYFGLKGSPTSATVNVANSSYIGNKVSVSKMSDFRVGDVITYGGAHTEIVTKIDGDKVYIAGFGSDTNIVKDASNGWNKAISKTLTVSQARNALGHSNTSMNVWRASENTYNVPSGE